MDSIKYQHMEKKKPHYNLQEAQAIVVREGLLVFYPNRHHGRGGA